MMNRRSFLKSLAIQIPALGTLSQLVTRAAGLTASSESLPPIRQITKGPKFHWFGYYDKFQFSTDNRFVLANEADFEGRSPRMDDTIRVGMVDLHDQDRWIELGSTRA